MSAAASAKPKYRPLKFGVTRITLRDGAPGVEYVRANLPLQPYAARITEQPADQGFMTEAMMAAIAQSAPAAKERVRAFLEGRADKVKKS